MKHSLKSLNLTLIVVIIFSLVFSFWLMFHTFSYQQSSLAVATKVWSDFASQIPLIRSFSVGSNFPVEHPLFPGEPIRYHFLFYALVGLLERLGVRIDLALNIPSALSFAAFLVLIYLLGKAFFKSSATGILSVVFFLLNGSLSFLEFFHTYPLSSHTLNDILNNSNFPSFGPYDGKAISAFWNLNIYTNQRHLALSFAIVLLTIYLLFLKKDRSRVISLLLGILAGILLFLNQAVFFIDFLWIGWFAILNLRERWRSLLIILIIPLCLLPFSILGHTPTDIIFKIGFLIGESPNPISLLSYWFLNIGLYLPLILLSWILAPKQLRWLIVPLLLLFIVPNTFQLSKDMINNHKFFNFFLIIGSMFVANLLVKLWQKPGRLRLRLFRQILCVVLFCSLIFSGIIDFMAITNDNKLDIPDLPASQTIQFIQAKTTPKSVFLNSTFLYNPVSLAGRPIFLGYPYFLWSYGYEYRSREQTFLSIYQAANKVAACNLLQQNKISYIELNDHPEEYIKPNWALWKNEFIPLFRDKTSGITIYSVSSSCR